MEASVSGSGSGEQSELQTRQLEQKQEQEKLAAAALLQQTHDRERELLALQQQRALQQEAALKQAASRKFGELQNQAPPHGGAELGEPAGAFPEPPLRCGGENLPERTAQDARASTR